MATIGTFTKNGDGFTGSVSTLTLDANVQVKPAEKTSEKAPDFRIFAGRAEIVTLVNTFYDRVRTDEVLGSIFDKIAQTNWTTHLPKMYGFWETVLFRSGGYTGNPLAAHAKLVPQTEMGRAQFDRWLTVFRSTVDDLFAGEKADHIKSCAEDMANVMYARINGVPDPRFDPANLTPEQRERYARCKAPATASA